MDGNEKKNVGCCAAGGMKDGILLDATNICNHIREVISIWSDSLFNMSHSKLLNIQFDIIERHKIPYWTNFHQWRVWWNSTTVHFFSLSFAHFFLLLLLCVARNLVKFEHAVYTRIQTHISTQSFSLVMVIDFDAQTEFVSSSFSAAFFSLQIQR